MVFGLDFGVEGSEVRVLGRTVDDIPENIVAMDGEGVRSGLTGEAVGDGFLESALIGCGKRFDGERRGEVDVNDVSD